MPRSALRTRFARGCIPTALLRLKVALERLGEKQHIPKINLFLESAVSFGVCVEKAELKAAFGPLSPGSHAMSL